MKNKINIKRQVVNEIHKPARINFKRRKVILKSYNDLFQADLADMQKYSNENRGYKHILIVINCFSKFVWAFPLKNKTGSEVAKSIEKVFQHQQPKNLQTDLGTEFFNPPMRALTMKYNINHYNVYSEKKASIAERVIRTLKSQLWKEFSFNGNYNWINILQNIINKYNNTKHRTIGLKPSKVNKKNEKQLLNSVYNKIKQVDLKEQKFQIGEQVRISKNRGVFDKKYIPNWSTEIFSIRKVRLTNPITYLLKDYKNENILGTFYNEQLQKVKYPDVYLVERILKRKGNKVFVKWLGFDNTHNSWIDKKNVL